MKRKRLLTVLCFLLWTTLALAQTPKFKCLQDLQISLEGRPEVTELVQCVDDPGLGKLRFRPSSLATPIFYLVTDPENVIKLASLKPTIDFSTLPPGAYRVWALSFVGLEYVEVGLDADTDVLASLCYELSDNFISIIRVIPDGKSVATANGDPAPLICTGDGRPNVLGFQTTSQDPFYAYAITDTNNVIIDLAPDGTYDFEDSGVGVCRVWGFSYVGAITARPGQIITETELADKCYDLSDDFVTVTKTIPDGGTVSLDDGRTEAVICAENDDVNTLAFASSSSSLAHFRFLLTDADNRLLNVLTEGRFDFASLDPGIYRILGLSFTGVLTVRAGEDVTTASLSDDCYDLSDNAIVITKKDPIGGELLLNGGPDGRRLCVNDGVADLLTFTTSAEITEKYIFILTNADNIIESFDEDGLIDFEGGPGGDIRIWGLGYSGNLTVGPGDDLDSSPLSDECFERSANFITLTRIALDGGTVQLEGGGDQSIVCLGDAGADVRAILSDSDRSTGQYLFVVTDDNNRILQFDEDGAIDFGGADPGVCRVWGLNFTGNLIAAAGQDAAATPLSDDCFQLSGNFVTIIRKFVDGGAIRLSEEVGLRRCANDGAPDRLTFLTDSESPESYAFLLTDENNTIIAVSTEATIDFEGRPAGAYRVWGLSYTGALTAEPGQDAAAVVLASECYELSENFVTVTNVTVDGGTISLEDGAVETTVCLGDSGADIRVVTSAGAGSGGAFVFVVTDADNQILQFDEDGSIDFGGADPGVCRVWGLHYTGALTAQPGQDAGAIALSDECYDLSDNFVTVIRRFVDGGSLRLEGDVTSARLCANDGAPDRLTFLTDSESPESYAFLLTDENNTIIAVSTEATIDFEGRPAGAYRVWGLSYTGALTAEAGQDAASATLAGECYELSENFLTITNLTVDGGTVSLENGAVETTVCLGDSGADIRVVNSAGAGSGGAFVFVVTDANNLILQFDEDGSIDFGGADPGVCRVWGLHYTGALTAQPGQDAGAIALSDECYDLSDNFVTVIRRFVDGGSLRLEGDVTSARLCANDGAPDRLTFLTDSESPESYAFLLTDENNTIIAVSTEATIDFEGRPAGAYRVWGLSYTGALTAAAGQDAASATLASECYELSENFLTITNLTVDGGTVSLENGAVETTVCLGDSGADIRVVNSAGAGSGGAFVFVITDADNQILQFDEDGTIDFGGADPGVCRVWGLHYTGALTAQPGQDVAASALSDECYDLSDNFVTVVRRFVDGGSLRLEGDVTSARLCANDGAPDPLTFLTDSESPESYTFLLTDENNTIIAVSTEATIDFEGRPAGAYRVWGLSYTGALTAGPGQDAASATLASECYELSENFLTITTLTVDGGTVSLPGGATQTDLCIGDDGSDLLTIVSSGAGEGGRFIFLLTDENNTILRLEEDGEIDFAGMESNTIRVWGLHYTGNLLAEAGQNAATTPLSDECYDLSDNFVSVIRRFVDGGFVAISTGATQGLACVGDGQPDLFEFVNQTSSNASYTFVITDDNDRILVILTGNRINFDVAPAGTCRVYGLSYTGRLTTRVNVDINSIALSDQCYELSENVVVITKEEVIGGLISLSTGEAQRYTCPDDGRPDLITLSTSGGGTGQYVYVVTTEQDSIVLVSANPTIDFEGTPAGAYRIRGLAYSGNLRAGTSALSLNDPLSDACYQLSGNALTIIHQSPVGGSVALDDGATERLSCPTSATPPVLAFDSTGVSGPAFTYLVTNESDEVQAIADGDRFDFANLPEGAYRVWGLAYSGNLTAGIGSIAGIDDLSDICYSLSENFILVVNREPDGGTVSTDDGEITTYTSPGDGTPNVVRVDSLGTVGRYAYLFTDVNNLIRAVLPADSIDMDTVPAGRYRVWGVAYIGQLLAAPGQNAATAILADECFDLSDNFVTINNAVPEAGAIATTEGQVTLSLCAGDGGPDLTQFVATGASPSRYAYLFTREDNTLIGIIPGDRIDFDTTGGGIGRIWGVAYTGRLIIGAGQDVTTSPLSTDNSDLSDNFITVNRTGVDGGLISSTLGQGTVYVCRGDGVADVLEFTNPGREPDATYRYVLTNETNRILGFVEGNQQDFENIGLQRVRIWGISFTGNLLARTGQVITEVPISNGCYTLSQNFITVVMDQPDGGVLTTTTNEREVLLCVGVRDPQLTFQTSSRSMSGFRYLLTDTNNVVLQLLTVGSIDFGTLPGGAYRVWGLSYTGRLQVEPGQDLDLIVPAGSCYDLSDNFVPVRRNGPVEGGVITTNTGADMFTVCPRNGVADILILQSTSTSTADIYRYVITDTSNRILIPDIEGNIIDFDGADPGAYRVWGISYTGTFTAGFGMDVQTGQLSNECYQVSSTFVTIVSQGPAGGQISTSDGRTGSFQTAACGGNAPDVLTFTDNGSATDAASYHYLISREDTVLAVVGPGQPVDFSTLSCDATYLVTGLAYSAPTLPAIVGATMSRLRAGLVLTECFDLSNNQLSVVQSPGFQGAPSQEVRMTPSFGEGPHDLQLAPNPALERLQVRFVAPDQPEAESELLIFNAAGQLQRRLPVQTHSGVNQLELLIDQLPQGVYFLQLRNGQWRQQARFVKSDW